MTSRPHRLAARLALALALSALTARAEDFETEVPPTRARPKAAEEPREYDIVRGSLRLRPRLILALDGRRYDPRNTRDSGLHLDRALVGGDLWFTELVTGRLLVDLRGTDTDYPLEEAWVAVAPFERRLRLTLGLQRLTLGIEHGIQEPWLPFVDYGFPAFLSGRHDLAARLDGELAEGLLSYDLAASAGLGYDLSGRRHTGPQLSLKLQSYPLRWLDLGFKLGSTPVPILGGLFVSGAVSYAFNPHRHLDVETSLDTPLFQTRRLEAGAETYRHLGYGFDWGPIRIIHEFTRGSLLDLHLLDGTRADLENQITAWSLSASWRITGEAYDTRLTRQRYGPPGLFPSDPIETSREGEYKGGIGALEIAVRYSNADIDRELIERGFTNERVSPQEFRAFDAALNYFPRRELRLTLQVTRIISDSDPQTLGGQGRDTSVAFRLQLAF